MVGTARAELKRWAKPLADKTDWRQIREDVEVKICRGPDGRETFLLCRSASRMEKEKAMHERFSQRIEEGLQWLARRIDKSKNPLERGELERQVGRLLERNSRAAARYSIAISEDNSVPAKLKLQWNTHSQWEDWANLTEGTYILRSNIHDWTDEELWKTYIQLSEAEAAFRIHKSDLCIRPIWHRKQGRIKAHILICFLATRYGRRCRNGSRAPAWATRRARFSLSCRAFTRLISSCHWLTDRSVSFGFVVWYGLNVSNSCSSGGSALLYPNGYAHLISLAQM